jgi:anti-sigma regulatory factor (Ser/Thr protein kinase)
MPIQGKTGSHRRFTYPDQRGGTLAQERLRSVDLHVELAWCEDAPAMARAVATAWCSALGVEQTVCETVRLLVSEVVTNAIRHSEAGPDTAVSLAASLSDGHVLVTVTDAGTGPPPLPRVPDPFSGGYGLFLLEQESRRWGVDRGADGTRVWFQLDASPGPGTENR